MEISNKKIKAVQLHQATLITNQVRAFIEAKKAEVDMSFATHNGLAIGVHFVGANTNDTIIFSDIIKISYEEQGPPVGPPLVQEENQNDQSGS